MTLPDERYRAVLCTERFLKDLLSTKSTPRVPKIIRQQAQALLRHYPSAFDMELASNSAPHIFQQRSSWLYQPNEQDQNTLSK